MCRADGGRWKYEADWRQLYGEDVKAVRFWFKMLEITRLSSFTVKEYVQKFNFVSCILHRCEWNGVQALKLVEYLFFCPSM
jgi:hypothetical protein